MPTVARILELTPVACYLSRNRVGKSGLFGQPIDPQLPFTIYGVYKILKRVYDLDPNYPGVRVVADYLYELIQREAFKSAAIVDGNTGGQIAPPSSGVTSINPLDFVVSATSYIPTGGTSITLDGTNGNPDFRGYDVNFNRNGTPQYTTSPPFESLYYNWNKVTGVFTLLSNSVNFTAAAQVDEQFRIMPDLGSAGSIAASASNTITITGSAFEPDGVTLNSAFVTESDDIMLFVSEYTGNWYVEGSFFTRTGTGLVINQSGFDANNYPFIIIQRIN